MIFKNGKINARSPKIEIAVQELSKVRENFFFELNNKEQ